MATPVVNGKPAAETLASQYDIHDPVFEYQVPEPTPPKSQASTAHSTQTPPSTPEQPVTPSTPGVTPPAPSVSPQKHPTWLLQHATDFGLHPLLVERLDTAELTQLVMDTMSKAQREKSANQLAAAVTSQSVQPNVPQPLPAIQGGIQSQSQVTPQAQSAWDWGIHDDLDDAGRPVKKQVRDEDIHPALAFHIKDQARRIKELETKLEGFQTAAANATGSQLQNAFDTAFNKIGGVFGSGTGVSLKGKPEFDRRATVYAAVKGMYSSLPESVRNTMTIEQAVFSMAKSLFNVDVPQVAAAATGNGQPTAEQFRTGGLQPPTQRRGPDQPLGVDFAKEQAANWWKENQASGGIPSSGGTSLDEFFPN